MSITLLAAVAANGVIGRDGDLPWRLPEDLAHFKQVTLGHALVMGRRTYDSIGRPLPGRSTVVLTRDPSWSAPGVTVAHDIESALKQARALSDEVYVVGGAEVYALAFAYADRLLLSEVEGSPEGDTCFPAYDRDEWVESGRDPRTGFDIVTYVRA